MAASDENEGTRVCEWCAETIPEKALRCSHCQKWRKDIEKEKILSYVWGLAAIVPAGLFAVGSKERWWMEGSLIHGYEFSFTLFLTSVSGLAVIASFIIAGSLSWHYYAKVSRKIGSWIWV
jgi:hypothetical protein